MKTRYILVIAIVLTLAGVVAFFSIRGRVPSNQPPLESLTAENLDDVKAGFNAAKDSVRILMFLSPT